MPVVRCVRFVRPPMCLSGILLSLIGIRAEQASPCYRHGHSGGPSAAAATVLTRRKQRCRFRHSSSTKAARSPAQNRIDSHLRLRSAFGSEHLQMLSPSGGLTRQRNQ